MRDKLNDNPLLQAAVIGVLLLGALFFFISSTGGGGEESAGGETEATVSVAGTTASGTATGATPGEAVEGALEAATEGAAPASVAGALAQVAGAGSSAPRLPQPVLDAWRANRTLVLLFVRDGGIDDGLVKRATLGVEGFGDVALFVVPAGKISRYAAITEGLGVDRLREVALVAGREDAVPVGERGVRGEREHQVEGDAPEGRHPAAPAISPSRRTSTCSGTS